MMDLVERARVFATAAHAAVGQRRKYTNDPYIVHPTEVAKLVATVAHTPEMLAAAYLHDTVEDTGVTLELIKQEFGAEVAELVGWLTDVSQPTDGNRAVRKAIDRDHTAMAPASAQTVKCADFLSNTASIMEHDKDFARVYLAEKYECLQVMTRADPALKEEAMQQVARFQMELALQTP